jgi:succinate dehydrogenase/fumarate reductase flavoprotein subunit
MGGVRVDAKMATRVPSLDAAGEAVGGANGANRLSGNAITEALVFGSQAGASAAARSARVQLRADAMTFNAARRRIMDGAPGRGFNPAAMIEAVQSTLQDDVGPFRRQASLARALGMLRALRKELPALQPAAATAYDGMLVVWVELETMTRVGECVASAALARTESRGAHQREDFPGLDGHWSVNQVIALAGDTLQLDKRAVSA